MLDEQVCLPKSQFYLVVFLSLLVMVVALYHLYYRDEMRMLMSRHRSSSAASHSAAHPSAHPGVRGPSVTEVDHQRMFDVLTPPIRRGPFPATGRAGVPIHTPTRGEFGPFEQVGYLAQEDAGDGPRMLPLMGRRIYSGKYQYYTHHHDNPSIKIVVKVPRDDEAYDGQQIHVDGYEQPFTIRTYPIDQPQYLPF